MISFGSVPLIRDLGTCTHTCTRTWGGKCCGRNPEFTVQKAYSKMNPLVSNGSLRYPALLLSISFNVCARVAWIDIHRNHSLFQCKCHVHVPFIAFKLFPNKYLGIQKQWGNEECSWYNFKRQAYVSLMLPFKHPRLVFNKLCCNVLFCFLATTDWFFPDWAMPAISITSQPAKNNPQISTARKKDTGVSVLMPYCTWCCRRRTFVLNFKEKEQFSLPSVRSLPVLMLQTHLSHLLNGHVCVIHSPNTSVDWRSRRKDNPRWGRERIRITTGSVAKGNKEKMFSLGFIHWECVSCGHWLHQCFYNLEICPRGASQISTSFKTLLRIYWENTWICNITSQLPAQMRNSLFSMLDLFGGKPQPVHFPSHEPPRGRSPKIFDAQSEIPVSERLDQILHRTLCPPHWFQLGYVDVNQHRKQHSPHAENVFLLNKSLL